MALVSVDSMEAQAGAGTASDAATASGGGLQRADQLYNDSVAQRQHDDSVRQAAPTFGPVPFLRCSEDMAPFSRPDSIAYARTAPAWTRGIAPEGRAHQPADDPGILSLLLALFVLIGFNMGNVRRMFHSLPRKLWSVRPRDNAFDEATSNETRTFGLLLMLLWVFEGLLTYQLLGTPSHGRVFLTVGALTALMAAYYLFDLCACSLVGYVFTSHTGAMLWRRGLNSSSALLGVVLAVPALLSLFYPACTTAMLWTGASLYVATRLIYIAKGFRIFYTNFPSLLYFILYLCTLEIIPVIVLYICATQICESILGTGHHTRLCFNSIYIFPT